ncbi:hypothetical protein KEM54_000158 [Ascosphaera aggregata]|nr:hypothetical protein KEM54_000158 [Ascosphaera aggregata]
MALFSPFSNDLLQPFQPLFQLLDDDTFSPVYPIRRANNAGNNKSANRGNSIASFTPRFDVRESKDAYHLDGDLPGLSQKDVELTFTDPHTLLIKGSITREYTESSEDKDKKSSADAPHHTPTVEDATDEKSNDQVTKPTNTESSVAKKDDHHQPTYKYWVSERSSGSFHRTFNFPARIDQDGVKASLKDGVLSVTVPKAPAPAMRKIEIN